MKTRLQADAPGMGDREILIVDDDESVLALFAHVLSEWGGGRGVSLLTARSADEAFEHLVARPASIELIISDLDMPGMRGSDFLLAVRERYPDMTTMIVSGHGDLEEVRKVIAAGVFSYLFKPCDTLQLVSEVEKALEVSRLKRENRRYEQRIREELRWAGELQKAFLRTELPPSDKFAVSVTYLPLAELQCGGDYCDVIPVAPQGRLLLVGDVGGHGIRAALVTAMLKSIISEDPDARSPRKLLERLNGRLCRELKRMPDIIVTFLACLADASSGVLTYANAGHLPFFVIRNGEALRLHQKGMGLGFDVDAPYEESAIPLESGDLIVLFTDGLVEGLRDSPSAAEADLARILVECRTEADFNAAVIERVKRQTGKDGFGDDVALLAVEVK